MSIEDSFNFRRVDERLTTSGIVSAEQLAGLRDEGYDAVINLLPDSNDRAVADEAGILHEQGVDYVHIPVDFGAPNPDDFEAFDRAMTARVDETVHVHCAANYRVTAFYALYASRHGLANVAEADALLREIWDPADFPAWAAFIAEERAR